MTPDNAISGSQGSACVGIVAGAGRLPVEIAEVLTGAGRKVHVVAIDQAADPALSNFPSDRIAIGQVGRLLSILSRNNCRDLIICGAIRRPDLGNLRTDLGFYRHLPRILSIMRGGDDAVLRRVMRFFEDQGFRVVGLRELVPELLVGVGALTMTRPAVAVEDDAAAGYAFLRDIGDLDIGQAVVVRHGEICAIEGAEGTDAMIRRLVERDAAPDTRGGTLVKASKPQQDLRIDIPTIGPVTVETCAAAGLDVIAVEAERSVIVDRNATLHLAEQSGVAIVGLPQTANGEVSRTGSAASTTAIEVRGRRKPSKGQRKDVAVALRTLARLVPHGAQPVVVVGREYVCAVGVHEHPIDVVRRARQLSSGRRRSGLGILGICATVELDTETITEAAGTGISGIAVQPAPRNEILDSLVDLADRAGLFVATEPS